ncbi:stage II sporulation protein R [Sedimentibacter sp. MB31-C6]|uniref:stage II sporulation protein R n=1 Tax=Sedimentibacter sp. MB31-C6 TaxID=3109366 RepID=UPI002DDCA9EF|nr:stage II sporulation protein R [Sedimentibacter sp. MB36-C1]WSI05417.1 stage II sporulation protein R [Sedimentibacter sp. MB36-C1]
MQYFNYKKKVILSILFVILAITTAYIVEVYSSMCEINDKVIRLHVVANSNTFEDQQLKYKIRNNIINSFNKEFQVISTKYESEKIIIEKISDIRKKSEETIKLEGYNYPINVYYGNYKFPRKQYEEIVLPEGNYDAVRIEIGKAEGNNWWCVMFPPLCFVDFGSIKEGEPVFDVDTEKKLNEILTEEEIELIKTKRGVEDIKLKSKIFEFIEKGRVENSGVNYSKEINIFAESLSDK